MEGRGPARVPSQRKGGSSGPAVRADPRLAPSVRQRPEEPGRPERVAHDAQKRQEEEHQEPLPDGGQVSEAPPEVGERCLEEVWKS